MTVDGGMTRPLRKSYAWAVEAAKAGHKVSRVGWNGKGMHVFKADGGSFTIDGRPMGNLEPHLVMFTADKKFVPWLCSQTDALAEDWGFAE